jgi:hypothetical protein
MTVWELIKIGKFHEACQKADEEFSANQDILPLRNKVFALLHLRKYEELTELSSELIKIRNGETERDFVYSGIGYWALNEKQKAIEIWKQGESAKYTDAAGGIEIPIILYFAGIKLKDENLKKESLQKLKKLLKSKAAINWPAPIGTYIIDKITKEELLTKVVNIDILRERQLCQAYFVIAIKELDKGNVDGYKQNLTECVNFGVKAYLESMYYIAKGELEVNL